MNSSTNHRGKHPKDEAIFANQHRPTLKLAVADLQWLLNQDYPLDASLKLVGDRYGLVARQRLAVGRAVASQPSLVLRQSRQISDQDLPHQTVAIDAFNLLLTLETMLSNGILLSCCDRTIRNMASMHGTYRAVQETQTAINIVYRWFQCQQKVAAVHWFIDQPVSNSGRLLKDEA